MSNFLNRVINDKKTNLITVLCLIFFSLLVIFPIGAINSSTVVENTSEYLADVAEDHTVNGRYAAMMIEPNDATDKTVNNPYYEFHYLYGIFREGLATYVGTVNADKSHTVKLKDIDEDVNFSFLNVDTGFGVADIKDKDGEHLYYKQEFYPLKLMFYSDHPQVKGANSFLYISQSRANCILDKYGLEHTTDNYKKILNKEEYLITLEFDGEEYKFSIDNIYLEDDYFYEALDETIGEFFLAGQWYPPGFKRQGLFFLRNYAYQNKYYIQYATKLYSLDDFDFKILDHNFTNGFKIDESKLVYVGNKSSDVWSILLLIFAVIVLVAAIILIAVGAFSFTISNSLFVGGAALIPYIIFWIIHAISKSALLFSNFSTTCEIWCLLGLTIAYFVLFLAKRNRRVKETE